MNEQRPPKHRKRGFFHHLQPKDEWAEHYLLFLNGSEFKSPREVLTLNYEWQVKEGSMDRPLLILPCTQRPRRRFSTSWPLGTGSRLRLHQVVWTSLYKLRRNLPLQMAFFGQSNCTAGGERWKTHAPKTVCPPATHPMAPTRGTALGWESRGAHSWRPGRTSECTGCKAHLGVAPWGRLNLAFCIYLGGGVGRRFTCVFLVLFQKAGIWELPPMCKVRNTPWWWSHFEVPCLLIQHIWSLLSLHFPFELSA